VNECAQDRNAEAQDDNDNAKYTLEKLVDCRRLYLHISSLQHFDAVKKPIEIELHIIAGVADHHGHGHDLGRACIVHHGRRRVSELYECLRVSPLRHNVGDEFRRPELFSFPDWNVCTTSCAHTVGYGLQEGEILCLAARRRRSSSHVHVHAHGVAIRRVGRRTREAGGRDGIVTGETAIRAVPGETVAGEVVGSQMRVSEGNR
jgi:hypothetical protein